MLTDEGRRRFRAAAPVYLAGIEEHFAAGLSDQDLQTLADILGRWRRWRR